MVYSEVIKNDTIYFVSVGTEYNNGAKIWISQMSYRSNITVTNETPNITMDGDRNFYAGRIFAFEVIIRAPGPYMFLEVRNFF